MKKINFNYAYIFLSLVVLVVLFLLLNPAYNYPHSESWSFLYSCFDNQDTFTSKVFNLCLDGYTPRTRVLSWLAFTLNFYFRQFIFDYIPYHASISLIWPFTLIFTPIYIYKFCRSFEITKEVSILSSAVFLLSIGNLSSHLMYFHASKALSALFLIMSLYYCRNYIENKKDYFKALIVIILGTMTDELYFVFYPAAYVILLERRNIYSHIKRLLRIQIPTVIFFIINITYIIPFIFRRYSNQSFNFWNYAISDNKVLFEISFEKFFFNLKTMLFSHLYPVTSQLDINTISFYAFLIIAFIFALLMFSSKRKNTYKFIAAAIIFSLTQYFILTRRNDTLFLGSYYWGNLFSVFLCLFLASIANSTKIRGRAFNIIFFTAIAVLFTNNSMIANQKYQQSIIYEVFTKEAVRNYQVPAPVYTKDKYRTLTWDDILYVWRSRDSYTESLKRLKELPHNAYWIYMYVHLKEHQKVKQRNKTWNLKLRIND